MSAEYDALVEQLRSAESDVTHVLAPSTQSLYGNAADAIEELTVEVERLDEFASFALEVLAIGGNGEGWTLADAIAALRVAVQDDGVNDRWAEPVSPNEWRRLRSFVGDEAVDRAQEGRQ